MGEKMSQIRHNIKQQIIQACQKSEIKNCLFKSIYTNRVHRVVIYYSLIYQCESPYHGEYQDGAKAAIFGVTKMVHYHPGGARQPIREVGRLWVSIPPPEKKQQKNKTKQDTTKEKVCIFCRKLANTITLK